MTIQYTDYTAPQGLYVATGTQLLPLASAAGATAFVGGAVQSGIGDVQDAAAVAKVTHAAVASAR
ncbi:MAG TPA: hypothetical protein VN238_19330 [Solirubrobacteraceae bacterium]|nr:hypothetical protein [Solirubrobacteraceae bacterium]